MDSTRFDGREEGEPPPARESAGHGGGHQRPEGDGSPWQRLEQPSGQDGDEGERQDLERGPAG
jgi:hypothetical protein